MVYFIFCNKYNIKAHSKMEKARLWHFSLVDGGNILESGLMMKLVGKVFMNSQMVMFMKVCLKMGK